MLAPECELEKVEGLEQLRALHVGIPIQTVEVDYRGRTHASIDNPEDVTFCEKVLLREGELV
jgi:3-deoxy-manno-octulosonate cytidylyltransferase (CMP-KDO synthetase)